MVTDGHDAEGHDREERDPERLAVIAIEAGGRWRGADGRHVRGAPPGYYRAMVDAVAAEVRRQERARVAALIDAAHGVMASYHIDGDGWYLEQRAGNDAGPLLTLRAALAALED